MKENNIPKDEAYYWYHIYKDKYTDEELKRNDKRSSELAAIEDYIKCEWGFIENYSFTNKMELRLEYSSFYHDLDYTSRLEMITNLSVFKKQYDKDRNVYITSHERKEGTELIQRTPSISAFVSVYNIYRKLNERVNGKQIKSLDRKLYGDDYCDRVKQTLLEFRKIDVDIMPPLEDNPFITNPETIKKQEKYSFLNEGYNWAVTFNEETRSVKDQTYTKWIALLLREERLPGSIMQEVSDTFTELQSRLDYDPHIKKFSEEDIDMDGMRVIYPEHANISDDLMVVRKELTTLKVRLETEKSKGKDISKIEDFIDKRQIEHDKLQQEIIKGVDQMPKSSIAKITKGIKREIDRLKKAFPEFGLHLEQSITVKEGRASYIPSEIIGWKVIM